MKFGRVGVLMKTQLCSIFLTILANRGRVIKVERSENGRFWLFWLVYGGKVGPNVGMKLGRNILWTKAQLYYQRFLNLSPGGRAIKPRTLNKGCLSFFFANFESAKGTLQGLFLFTHLGMYNMER